MNDSLLATGGKPEKVLGELSLREDKADEKEDWKADMRGGAGGQA